MQNISNVKLGAIWVGRKVYKVRVHCFEWARASNSRLLRIRRLIEVGDIVIIILLGFCFLFDLIWGVNCVYLDFIKAGGGACNAIVGLEFGSILMNPLSLHFSLNFHVINANKIIFWWKLCRALREHECPAIWVSLDFGTSFRCAHVMLNFFHYSKYLLIVGCGY